MKIANNKVIYVASLAAIKNCHGAPTPIDENSDLSLWPVGDVQFNQAPWAAGSLLEELLRLSSENLDVAEIIAGVDAETLEELNLIKFSEHLTNDLTDKEKVEQEFQNAEHFTEVMANLLLAKKSNNVATLKEEEKPEKAVERKASTSKTEEAEEEKKKSGHKMTWWEKQRASAKWWKENKDKHVDTWWEKHKPKNYWKDHKEREKKKLLEAMTIWWKVHEISKTNKAEKNPVVQIIGRSLKIDPSEEYESKDYLEEYEEIFDDYEVAFDRLNSIFADEKIDLTEEEKEALGYYNEQATDNDQVYPNEEDNYNGDEYYYDGEYYYYYEDDDNVLNVAEEE